jgi:hypothetical protein
MSKESIINRINALLAKTTEAGCTEAEAALAFQKAQQLMMQNAIEQGELGLRAEKCELVTVKRRDKLDLLLNSLAAFCGCRTYISKSQGSAYFFGLPSDLQIVQYMYSYLSQVLEQEAAQYRKTGAYAELRNSGLSGIAIGHTFRLGLAARLGERLRDMTRAQEAQERQETGNATGTALVIVKNQVVNQQYTTYQTQAGRRFVKSSMSRRNFSSHDAYHAGRAAGDGVALNRGGITCGQRAISAQ